VIYVWHLDASDVATFEYLREHRHERPPPIADGSTQWSPSPGSAEDAESESDAQSMAEDDDDDVFKLVVRSGVTKDVTLKVRPTTTCGAIVKAFLKRAGIADKHIEGKNSRGKSAAGGPRLMIDGEHMSPDIPISEADLEDGDQVEITGL
jgi:Ubiquitin-2 like Rad60 SUMO-like